MRVVKLGVISSLLGFGYSYLFLASMALNAAEPSEIMTQQGELVIYRKDKTNRRKGVYFNLYVNNQKVGKMKNNRAFHLSLPPGEYMLSSNDRTQRRFKVEVLSEHKTRIKIGIVKESHYGMSYKHDKSNEYSSYQNLKHHSLSLK